MRISTVTLILTILLLAIPVYAEDTSTETTSGCPYLKAMAAAGEKPDADAAKRCPVAGKTADGKGCGGKMSAGCCSAAKSGEAVTDGSTKASAGCCAGKSAVKCPVTGQTAEMKSSMQEKCPVMNRAIDKKLYVDHDGKRIYVCCPGCIEKVKADPGKYIKQIESEGIELEKVET